MKKKTPGKKQLIPKIDKVEGMRRKTYLKYYISVLEENIEEAKKILKQKKQELKKLSKK